MPSISMPPALVRFLQLLIVLSSPLVLVIGSVRLLVTDQYLRFEYGKTSFPPDPFGWDTTERLAYATANFRYVREGQAIDMLANQQQAGAPLYNERELGHMQDVQAVFRAVWWIWQLAFTGILLVGFALAWRRETRSALTAAVRRGGLLTAGVVTLIGGLAVIAWQVWFVAFHQIFFAAGTWTFEYTDSLIRMFPEQFWFDAAVTIAAVSLIGGLLLVLISRRLPHQPITTSRIAEASPLHPQEKTAWQVKHTKSAS